MRPLFTLSTALLASGLIFAPLAQASVEGGSCSHIKAEDLEFIDLGTKLKVKGKLKCLEEEDVNIEVEAMGLAKALCKNPGDKFPPGQNPKKVWVEVEGDTCIDENEIENECTEFKVITHRPELGNLCPNSNWTTILKDVSFTKAKITIEQGGTEKVIHCSFPGGSSNGEIDDVDCY